MKTRVWHIQSLLYVCRLQFLSIFSSGKEEVQVPFRNSILLLVRVGHSEGAHPLNGQGGDCFLQLWDSLLGCAKSRQSCLTLCDPMDCSPPGSSVHGDSPGHNPGVGCCALLQGDLTDPGIEPRPLTLQGNSLSSEPPDAPQSALPQHTKGLV